MSQEYLIQKDTLTDIADAVRKKGTNVQEITEVINCLEITPRIDDINDLQFFVMSTDSATAVSTTFDWYKQNRYHDGAGILVSNQIDPTILDTKIIYNATIQGSTATPETIGTILATTEKFLDDYAMLSPVDDDSVIYFKCLPNQDYKFNSTHFVGGFEKEPNIGLQGAELFNLAHYTSMSGGAVEPRDVTINSGSYTYLAAICDTIELAGSDIYAGSNQHYIISETEPEMEKNLLWIKYDSTIPHDNYSAIPLLYNAPMQHEQNSTKLNNNIFIWPTEIKWCIDLFDLSGLSGEQIGPLMWFKPADARLDCKDIDGNHTLFSINEQNEKPERKVTLADALKHEDDSTNEDINYSPEEDGGLNDPSNGVISLKKVGYLGVDDEDITSIRNFGMYSHTR